jgi:SLOG in TRPM, prokaryote
MLRLNSGRTAPAVRVHTLRELPAALRKIGVPFPRPALVVVGGAGSLGPVDLERLRPVFTQALAPLSAALGAAVIDGGTDAGVMRLMGEAYRDLGLTTPLIGVAAEGTIELPDAPHRPADATPLEPHHTHFILVPGHTWGDESPWIARVADVVASGAPSTTVLLDGGEIARQDVTHSVAAGRRVLVVAGSGRTADAFAAALANGTSDAEMQRLVRSGLLQVVGLADGPVTLATAVRGALRQLPVA